MNSYLLSSLTLQPNTEGIGDKAEGIGDIVLDLGIIVGVL